MTEPAWIWFRPPPPARDAWGEVRDTPSDGLGYLRRAFTLARSPGEARCRVSADGRYELFVNGTRAGHGPERSQLFTYDEYDIAPWLREGENVIAALVRWYGRPTVWWRPVEPRGDFGYGGFWLACEKIGVVSDATWRARPAAIATAEPADSTVAFVPPATEGPPPLEIHDGRAWSWGWERPGFDEEAWDQASVLQGNPGALRAREAPLPVERIAEPTGVVARGRALGTPQQHPLDAVYADEPGEGESLTTFDFGGIVHGHPMLVLDAEPGAVVDLACGEDLDGKPVTAPREWAMRAIAGGDATFDSFEAVGFRYLSVAVRSGVVRDARVAVRERLAPRTPGASFRCSDPLLGDIFDAGVRTVDLCSTDTFIDCPGREQRAWLGDAYLTSMLRMVIDPDPSLVRATLRLHARGARPDGLLPMVAAGDFSTGRKTIPDHSLLWVGGVNEYVRTGGDLAIAEELAPVAERALAWFESFRGDDGLLYDVPEWIFIDWAQLARGRTIAALDAFYAWALDRFAELCDALGNDGSAGRARARAQRTRDAFGAYWDSRRGAYVDALGARRFSQQTNAIAIVSRCAPRERWKEILDRVLDEGRLRRTLTPGDAGVFAERMNTQWRDPPDFDDEEHVVLAQPFFAHFLHRAMIDAGRPILGSIRRWRALLDRGNGCFEEYWDAEPGLGSRCHAWSCTPTYDLARHVLGVWQHGDDVTVSPHLEDLEWAEGSVATTMGFVRVSVQRGLQPRVEAPAGVAVRIG